MWSKLTRDTFLNVMMYKPTDDQIKDSRIFLREKKKHAFLTALRETILFYF
jgi:hypothetical protein